MEGFLGELAGKCQGFGVHRKISSPYELPFGSFFCFNETMRVRHIVSARKTLVSETTWDTSGIPPRHAPIYTRSKPIRAGWRWKSARLKTDAQSFILLAECNPLRDNWKVMLLINVDDEVSVIGRLEHHGSHPGLHLHSHCDRCGIERGASGMDNLRRWPQIGRNHRRNVAWTEGTFWETAKRFFHVEQNNGPLFNHKP